MSILKLFSVLDVFFNAYMFSKHKYTHGDHVTIYGKVHIHGRGGKISFGNHVTITSSDDKNPTDGSVRTHLSVYPNAELLIGDHSGLSNCAVTAAEKVTIGKNVMIGSGCMITDTDFHSVFVDDRINGNINIQHSPVSIMDNVFIGARCIILKGVHIGENSVVGAGSVVTKNIPENEIWAGNPAKFIRKL